MTQSLYSCLSFPGRKSQIFYALLLRNLRLVWFYHTFPHFLINTIFFEKKKFYFSTKWYEKFLIEEEFNQILS
jgi:hypothetical protein